MNTHANHVSFIADLVSALNCNSMENGSNTPDFILGKFMDDCRAAFDAAVREREKWHRDPFLEHQPKLNRPTDNIAILEKEVADWSRKNFGDQPAWKPLLGVAEEVGELNHAFLKQSQNIRRNEDHAAKERDAVGDIVIYLADYCGRRGFSLAQCVADAWAEVSKRDWTNETP